MFTGGCEFYSYKYPAPHLKFNLTKEFTLEDATRTLLLLYKSLSVDAC